MKKALFLSLLLFASFLLRAQKTSFQPSIAVKWAPTGLLAGNISLLAEYNFGHNSLTAKLGLPLSSDRSFTYDGRDADFSMRASSFLAGYRHYLSHRHMKGFYLEPYFKYVHHISEGTGSSEINLETVRMNFTNDYNGIGVGAQLGVQFLVRKRFVIDLFFLGPEINSARNNFKAVEVSNNIPWTSVESRDAEQDIRDFIDKFPFVRNKVKVMVDQENKTVRADFQGALPGIRAGISVGFAF